MELKSLLFDNGKVFTNAILKSKVNLGGEFILGFHNYPYGSGAVKTLIGMLKESFKLSMIK